MKRNKTNETERRKQSELKRDETEQTENEKPGRLQKKSGVRSCAGGAKTQTTELSQRTYTHTITELSQRTYTHTMCLCYVKFRHVSIPNVERYRCHLVP